MFQKDYSGISIENRLFIHLTNIYVPGTVLGAKETMVNNNLDTDPFQQKRQIKNTEIDKQGCFPYSVS